MRQITSIILFLSILVSACTTEEKQFEAAVRNAVERQMQQYPQSTLKDLYKNFFQDVFGPGHIISDTTAAGNYLRQELDSYSNISGEVAEPLGWRNNFLRVNLSVIKEGIIPYDMFFDAFVSSINEIQPKSVLEWAKEWNKIEAIIYSLYPTLPDYTQDKQEIINRLARGEYIGHHSKTYEEVYQPHYRIINRELYEKKLLPLLIKYKIH